MTPASVRAEAPAADSHVELLLAVGRDRDTAAFIALFNHFAPRLKTFMKRLAASDELAEELAQDVMFTVWRKAASYDPAKSAVSSWIFTIARNARIDELRRTRRQFFDLNEPTLLPEPAPEAELLIEAAQRGRRVRAALAILPREQAAVIHLAYYESKTHGEIAALLAIPLGTVKSRLRLAFHHLRTAFAQLEPPGRIVPLFPACSAPAHPEALVA